MTKAVLKAGCKVNIYFEILNKRSDGYHNIESLFLPLPRPYDEIYIEEGKEFVVRCNIKELEKSNNILYKTYHLFSTAFSFKPKICVYLKKRIPIGSGLGGGSSDAAEFLKYLSSIAPRKIPMEKLKDIAKKIGADVPFFLKREISWVQGIGEVITPLTKDNFSFNFKYLILLIPPFEVSTSYAYKRWDDFFSLTKFKIRFKKILAQTGRILKNSFESVLFSETRFKELREIKVELLRLGFKGVVLSGSGSSMVGVCDTKDTLLKGCGLLKNKKWTYYVYKF